MKSILLKGISLVALAFVLATGAQAQIYVSNGSGLTAYNASTGAVENTYAALANDTIVVEGNTVYAISGSNLISYNLTTGSTVTLYSNRSDTFSGLAVSGSTLYYEAGGGANPAVYALSTAGGTPVNLPVAGGATDGNLDVVGTDLYIGSDPGGNQGVTLYNLATGVAGATNGVAKGLPGTTFTTAGNDLLVSSVYSSDIAEYNLTTGALITSDLVTVSGGGQGMEVIGGDLYVGSYNFSTNKTLIGEFNLATGAAIDANLINNAGSTFSIPEIAATPEPRSWLLSMVILGAVGVLLRRKALRTA
jgi:hypothetical protein